MNTSAWFDDLPVLGRMPPHQAAAKLREVGEDELAAILEGAPHKDGAELGYFASSWPWPFQSKSYVSAAHAFGYIAPISPGDPPQPIRHAGNIVADATLR